MRSSKTHSADCPHCLATAHGLRRRPTVTSPQQCPNCGRTFTHPAHRPDTRLAPLTDSLAQINAFLKRDRQKHKAGRSTD